MDGDALVRIPPGSAVAVSRASLSGEHEHGVTEAGQGLRVLMGDQLRAADEVGGIDIGTDQDSMGGHV
jgi:hypothetical protein